MIRPAIPDDVPGIARVHVDTWRTAYEGILAPSFLSALKYESREEMWQQILASPSAESHLIVAVSGQNELIGFASGGASRYPKFPYTGEINAIYLRKAFERQGIVQRQRP